MTWLRKKYAPWQHEFDQVLGYLRDTGIFQKLFNDPLPAVALQKWKPKRSGHRDSLTLEHIIIPLCLLGAGLLLATVAFRIEFELDNKDILYRL